MYEGTDYGCSNEDLIGSNFPFEYIQEELKRQTLEALVQHEEINSIYNWQFVREGSAMTINFTVDSIYGISQQGVAI